MSTPEEIQLWTDAIEEIMSQHPDWSEADANAGLVWAVTDAQLRSDIEELAKHQADVELWTSVIADLMERFPEWTEQEANDNLIALLAWFETHGPSATEQRIPDTPLHGPR